MQNREIPKEWSEVGELTEAEYQMLGNIEACKKACEKLVMEVVKHYEQNSVMENAFWDVLFKRLGFSRRDVAAVIEGKSIKLRCKTSHDFEETWKKLEMNKGLRDKIRESLNSHSP